jgi:hypothetical protein
MCSAKGISSPQHRLVVIISVVVGVGVVAVVVVLRRRVKHPPR